METGAYEGDPQELPYRKLWPTTPLHLLCFHAYTNVECDANNSKYAYAL